MEKPIWLAVALNLGIVALPMCLANVPASAQMLDSISWVTSNREGCVIVVDPSGDVFTGFRRHGSQSPWSPAPNVFSSTGATPGELVGVGSNGTVFYALTADGRSFLSTEAGASWFEQENVLLAAGRDSASDLFVGLGTIQPGPNTGPGTVYAVTQRGDVYTCCWGLLGNVFGEQPVPLEIRSWGRIKADRR